MTPDQIRRVQESFKAVAPITDTAAELFYERLFRRAPHLRPLFPADLAAQKKKLMTVLGVAVAALDRIETLLPMLRDLGARHAGYGVRPEHYAPVGAALLETLETGLGSEWTPELREAWTAVYAALSGAMLEGSAAQAA